jgi:hypothetical protein
VSQECSDVGIKATGIGIFDSTGCCMRQRSVNVKFE